MTFAPPRPPSPAEREALIREARERQRRRRLLAAAGVAVAAGLAVAAQSLLGSGAGRTRPSGADGASLCGPGCESNPPGAMLAVTSAYYRHGSFEGSALLRVNPRTLRPQQRRPLCLGDAVMTQVPSPNGNRVALGGVNMGEILFADRSLRHVSRLTLVPHWQRNNTVEVDVEAWPLPSRVIAVATLDMAPWWAPKPSQLFVVDPVTRRVVRRVPLHGTVGSTVSVRNGTTALVVDHGRSSRVVVVTPQGATWSRSLRGLGLDAGKGVRADGTRYRPWREPALATDGRNRVFVVASDRPIGEIRLSEHDLRYHGVAVPRRYLSYPAPTPPGSAAPSLSFGANATWLGHGMLAIGGGDDLPVPYHGSVALRYPYRKIEIVDTRTWRRARELASDACQPAGEVTLCDESVTGLPPRGKGVRGPSIVGYDTSWHRLWASPSSRLGWEVTAGRLIVWPEAGSGLTELDPATGRTLRRIGPAVFGDFSGGEWPTLLALPRPTG